MAQCFRHLQDDERCEIRALHTHGLSTSEIARQVARGKQPAAARSDAIAARRATSGGRPSVWPSRAQRSLVGASQSTSDCRLGLRLRSEER